MSWKPQVYVQGEWHYNGLAFETQQEAEDNAHALFMRWTACVRSRAVESTDPVNYKWVNDKLEPITSEVK